MNEVKKEIANPEIFHAIKNSITDARSYLQNLAEVFSDNIQPLRLEESESVFTNLTQNIQNLEGFLVFIGELKDGMKYYDDFGLSSDPITTQDAGLKLFREMFSAMESKDWIMLSDLIEYELSPMLIKEDEWLGSLDEKLMVYEG